MSPETMALTLFVIVIFSMVPSRLASEVIVIPKCDIFYKKKKKTIPKGFQNVIYSTKKSNIGVSKEYSFC